jgi:hypothetical protein
METKTVLTVKELRQLLFEVIDQEMTVRQLRSALFQLDDTLPIDEVLIDLING